MDVSVLIPRASYIICFILHVFFTISADGLGIAEFKYPAKFSHNAINTGAQQAGRLSRSENRIGYSNLRESGIPNKVLEFIELVRTNSTLRKLYCNKSTDNAISLTDFKYTLERASYQRFHKQEEEGRLIANYLTNFFVHYSNIQIQNLSDVHAPAIVALLRSILLDDTTLAGGGIAFNNRFFPYIYTTETGGVTNATDLGLHRNYEDAEFYYVHSKKKVDQSAIRNAGSGGGGGSTSGSGGDMAVTVTDDDEFWGQPTYDCNPLKRWIIALSYPFYEKQSTKLAFKGVVFLEIDLNKTDINQCDDSSTMFAGSHQCRPETTQCKYEEHGGFSAGNYQCHCKPGFFFPVLNATQKFYAGTLLERHFLSVMRNETNFSSSDFQCLPCRQECRDCTDDGCLGCEDDSPCFVEYNILMRGIPLGIQSFCMTITLVLGIVVLRFRKSKVMMISMWCMMELILLGAVLLYATVVIQYFEPSTTTCLIVPWFREVGFAILYGALILKIYRLLADFQSRKAHRVHVRDKDLLKYLLCVIVVVTGYMAAWTAINIDHVQDGKSLIETGKTSEHELRYFVCKTGWWDYATEIGELLFLCFGIYMCYRVRAAPSEYSEGTYVSAAICYECFISTVFYVLRHIYWLELHPDYLFLMYFLRCQLTVTVTLILVFGPKLWYAHRPPDDMHIRNRAYSSSEVPDSMAPETLKLNVGISSNGDVDVGDVSLADMDPEDIRLELKRLYTQLQIYKTRNMRKDNPHISKRRGGRKQTHRRFSLQAFHHKHRHHHEHEHEHEMSKTPEESTNSAEGLPMPIEMNTSKCDEVHENKPGSTVSFKMCHTTHK